MSLLRFRNVAHHVAHHFLDSILAQKLAHLKHGYLKKQGGSEGGRKSWKKRYFVLTDEAIEYYDTVKSYENHVKPLGIVFLSDFVEMLTGVPPDADKDVKERAKKNPDYFFFALRTTGRLLWMYTKIKKEMEEWVDGMKRLGEMQLAISALEPPSEREKKVREHMERERALGRKRKSEKTCTCIVFSQAHSRLND